MKTLVVVPEFGVLILDELVNLPSEIRRIDVVQNLFHIPIIPFKFEDIVSETINSKMLLLWFDIAPFLRLFALF